MGCTAKEEENNRMVGWVRDKAEGDCDRMILFNPMVRVEPAELVAGGPAVNVFLFSWCSVPQLYSHPRMRC